MLGGMAADYHIRKYQDSDHEAVCAMFREGLAENIPDLCRHVLKLPLPYLMVLGVFLTALAISGSFLLSSLAVVLSLPAAWHAMCNLYYNYINHCLREDMSDIPKTYLQSEDSCFWVAESGGTPVGMIAAIPPQHPSEEGVLELKRLSIRKAHRGRGLAKALCRTLIRFAQERKFRAVYLETTMVQYAALSLYERMGFVRVRQWILPTLCGRIARFRFDCYRYELPG